MVSILYNALILPLLRMALWAGRALSPKLRLRSGAEKEALRRAAKTSGNPRILFHASSMGELEQVIPIMHELKRRMPNGCIILSCSSPSGYNHALRQPCIDAALYLPIDTRRNARRFIEATSPDVFVINRYDVWPNVVKTAVSRCRVLLINATYPSVADSPLLRKWVKKFYRKISSITAVSESDAAKLSALCDRTIRHIPDTRVDRVLERIASADATTDILRSTDRPTLLLGSTWPEDEDLLFATLLKIDASRLRLIIVPHEPTEQALKRIEQHVSCQRLSRIQPPYDGNVLVDSVGHLLSLYRLADAAYVGAGLAQAFIQQPNLWGMASPWPAVHTSHDLGMHKSITGLYCLASYPRPPNCLLGYKQQSLIVQHEKPHRCKASTTSPSALDRPMCMQR